MVVTRICVRMVDIALVYAGCVEKVRYMRDFEPQGRRYGRNGVSCRLSAEEVGTSCIAFEANTPGIELHSRLVLFKKRLKELNDRWMCTDNER